MSSPSDPVAIVDDERFDAHADPGGGHPECPERLAAARSGLVLGLPEASLLRLAPHEASPDELRAVHVPGYLDALEGALAGSPGHLDRDTFFNRGTRQAAWLAAGGAAALARSLQSGQARTGVALLRPPGHHAEPGRAMGFCLLNNVAIAAHAARAAGAKRVAIIDWDVHHGNGTQSAFYDDPDVLFVSLHQYPFYPGTGAANEIGRGKGIGKTINVALPAGAGPETYGLAFRRVVQPALASFAPELVFVSAGFDAHASDPLAQMQLDADTFAAMASALLAGSAPVGFILEGGYDLQALEASVGAVARTLAGHRLALPQGDVPLRHRDAIERTCQGLAPHWPEATFEPTQSPS